MAFDEFSIFLAALIFLILGNGMFKPNMSTQVGRLYPVNDGRRDAAYTIFYMGINLGAFLAPLACGWLADNTVGGYHTGFTLAGIGMVVGLATYLAGQPLIHELDQGGLGSEKGIPGGTPTDLEGATAAPRAQQEAIVPSSQKHGIAVSPDSARADADRPLSEAEAERVPSVLGSFGQALPLVLYVLAGVLLVLAPVILWRGGLDQWPDAVMAVIACGCLALMGHICAQVHNGVRDRVLAILVLGVFVIFFWGAFEQAGNVLNLWADKNTNRYLWEEMRSPAFPVAVKEETKAEVVQQSMLARFANMFRLKPASGESKTWGQFFNGFFNPIATTWFQSINALAIFLIAPVFAALWVWLDRKKMQPSIALKMFFGLVFMSAGVAVMIGAAQQEDRQTTGRWTAKLPPGIETMEDGKLGFEDEKGRKELFHAGRLTLADGQLAIMGVLPDTERDRILEQTAPKAFREKVEELAKLSEKIKGDVKEASVVLDAVPPGFDMRYSGLKRSQVTYDEATKTLTAKDAMKAREKKGLLVAASDPAFRDALGKLFVDSATLRVSSWWLFWSYILATLGELCLSPVGLSMVSKLAPAKFATMLMGVWMLTSAFGNFAAGAAGELWGTVAPVPFFFWLSVIVAASALVLLALARLVVRAMHGVK